MNHAHLPGQCRRVLRCQHGSVRGDRRRTTVFARLLRDMRPKLAAASHLQTGARCLIEFAKIGTMATSPRPGTAVSGQDQATSRASLSLYPRGLLPCPLLPQSRRPERPICVICSTRWPIRACTPRRQRIVHEVFAEEKPRLKASAGAVPLVNQTVGGR